MKTPQGDSTPGKPDRGVTHRVVRAIYDGTFPVKVVRRVYRHMVPDKLGLPELEFRAAKQLNRDLIFDDICLPPFYGSGDHDDATPLFGLLRLMNPSLVIEFGTAHGNITANICRQTEAQVITVNALPERLSGQSITFTLARDEIGRVYRKYGYASRVRQVYANTLEVNISAMVAPASADVGIIDACHDYEYVKSDFLKLAPLVRDGGIILLHDTHPGLGPPRDGSYKACRDLRKQGWDVMHIRDTWWGLWVRGGFTANPLARILRSSRRLSG